MGATMADSAIIRCKRRKQANPQRKNIDIDGNPKGMTPGDLSDGNDPISPSPENGYHSNSSTIEDSDVDDKDSFRGEEDEEDVDEVEMDKTRSESDDSMDDGEEKDFHRKNGLQLPQLRNGDISGDGVINLEEYMNRSDTAVIYPEPVEDMDGVNGDTDDPDSPGGNDNETENDGELGKPVDCPYCERSYKRWTSLKEHIKYRHEKTFNNFSCPECNYCFAYKSQLERHMATHMPGRNQVCEICNKAFVNIYRLQRHMLTHTTGNRKFKCSECGKAFKYKHHLKEHLRIHSGEKPYECPTCLKRFSHSGSYSSHISSKKCSPVKEQPQGLARIVGVPPVKVINNLPSPVLCSPISDIEKGESRPSAEPKNNATAYMTPLHIKIPNADGSVEGHPSKEKQENGSTTPLTSPPNDAVKKVLQIVASTVSKQQQDGQKTDISKLKKTKTSSDTPVVASPFEIRPFKLEKLSAIPPLPKATPEKKAEETEKPKVFLSESDMHPQKKSYDIVDYTLRKVHEAQAINRCLESRFPTPINLNPDRTGCKYCGREYLSPIDLHQHERYLCDLNEDVLKMKLFNGNTPQQQQSMANFKLDRYYEMQQQFIAQHNGGKSQGDKDNEADKNERDNPRRMLSSPAESERHLSPKASPVSGSSHSPCSSVASPPAPETGKSNDDILQRLESISQAQEQALRAFYAMQAKPSEDGIDKISVALNLPMQVVNKWFQRTRKLEEEGSDPSLKSLSLMKQSPAVSVVQPANHSKDIARVCVIETEKASVKSKEVSCDLETASVSSSSAEVVGDVDSPPASPYSSNNSLSKDLAKDKYHSTKNMDVSTTVNTRIEHNAPGRLESMDRDSRSPSRSLSPEKTATETSPLDLSMPKRKTTPPLSPSRSSIPPKLIYGLNYSAFYSAAAAAAANGYLLPPTYAPSETVPTSVLENSIKAHTNVAAPIPSKSTTSSSASTTSTTSSENSFLLKRSYPESLYAYMPMNSYPPKRMRFADGVDYPAAPPPLYPHLQVPDVYSALAKTGYMQSTLAHHLGAMATTNPFLPAMLNGAGIHQNHTDASSDIASDDALSDIGIGPGRRRRSDRPSRTSSGQYACSQCPKTFQKHSSLLRHVYEHSGKRPHQCKECGKAFKHKHHLMEHSRLHSGEKPYQCDRCLKKFSHSGSYSQHMNHRYSYCRREAIAGGGLPLEGAEMELKEGKDMDQGGPEEMELESTGAMIRRLEEKQAAGM
ncbi:zinc finger E-box-binding homeobox 1-like isoform X1 [Diadema antillarum]|uniref:zinc finger E-box-binding homeobox 1-like isoform X1 n=1 Tax=Diadema antillarum TaxID=105358 RepID=UPI003A86AFE2